ncbi:TetR/AcrR family transcriptional regulator [Novosphingobium bradum]|uniref:TetR/AcrR family transcriptional regulator n=1 Tax=Novosphingobium bradum TaxID=1737444 RepID=A0ABV7IRL4_9SPHN
MTAGDRAPEGRTGRGALSTRLIREARAMLREQGHPQFNLRELAARAGITAGAMYYHFESKTELLAALAAVGFRDLSHRLESAALAVPVSERLRVWAREYARFAQAEPALMTLMFLPEIGHAEDVVAARQGMVDQLRRVVEEMLTVYHRDRARLGEVTLAIWAAAHGGAALDLATSATAPMIEEVINGLEAVFNPTYES